MSIIISRHYVAALLTLEGKNYSSGPLSRLMNISGYNELINYVIKDLDNLELPTNEINEELNVEIEINNDYSQISQNYGHLADIPETKETCSDISEGRRELSKWINYKYQHMVLVHLN
jgi:hypothetical protein